jgi:thiol-disulfide isomerase/thioredoxin
MAQINVYCLYRWSKWKEAAVFLKKIPVTNMNKYWLLLLILGALGCQPFNQRGANQMVSIQGTLEGFDTGTMVLLNPMDRDDVADAIMVEDGKFSWTGYADKAKPMYLVIRDTPYDNGVYVILEPGDIRIKGAHSSNGVVEISGTRGNEELNELNHYLQSYAAPLAGYGNKYARALQDNNLEEIERLTGLHQQVTATQQAALNEYIDKHGSSQATLLAMFNLYRHNPDGALLEKALAKLSPGLLKEPMGVMLQGTLNAAQRTAVGRSLPDFQLKDIAISSLRGKYVLVDFWASWSAPCRADHKRLAQTYAAYKNKGLEILSVSADKDPTAWQQAISSEGSNWLHANNRDIYRWYAISSFPMNFLIDREGKIVARGIHGKELDQLLAQTL